MNIDKFETLLQEILYSKPFRLPKWIWRKVKYRQVDPTILYEIKMKIGHQIQLYPTQNYLTHTLINQQYHDENIFMLKNFLSPQSIIIDVGANIGLYTCAYAEYYRELQPTIYAIEAVDSNFNLLNLNINQNNFTNVKSYHLAFGNQEGFLEFLTPHTNYTGNFAANNINQRPINSQSTMITKKVRMTTLDQFAQEISLTKCDFIKVDIEGAEYFFFNGGINFIKRTRPVIQFEYNKFWLDKNSITFKHFYDLFAPLDYFFYVETKNQYVKLMNPDQYEVIEGLVDFLLVPKERI
jgi:FkbM family methyltransferase